MCPHSHSCSQIWTTVRCSTNLSNYHRKKILLTSTNFSMVIWNVIIMHLVFVSGWNSSKEAEEWESDEDVHSAQSGSSRSCMTLKTWCVNYPFQYWMSSHSTLSVSVYDELCLLSYLCKILNSIHVLHNIYSTHAISKCNQINE